MSAQRALELDIVNDVVPYGRPTATGAKMNDATALAACVRAGEIDAATTVEEAIARCEQVNLTINAIVASTRPTEQAPRLRPATSARRQPWETAEQLPKALIPECKTAGQSVAGSPEIE